MTAKLPQKLTIRAALLLGFGLTLGVWLWTGYDFLQRTSHVQREVGAINLRYMKAQELLATVRPQVLIVSVNARTALLDPAPGQRTRYRDRVRSTLRATHDTLEHYVPVLNSEVERERVALLGTEIESFGQAVLGALADDRPATPAEARELLARIIPRRELVIGVTDEVQALNRAAFVQEQATIAKGYQDMQTSVWERLGLSLVASLGIALFASVYAGRLEAQLRRQGDKEAQNTRDLQRLSARLVDAQEQERRIIARELHDELGQALEAIGVELALAQKRLHDETSERLLDDAQSITQTALHAVRDLSHLLHPAVLDDLGLVAAVDGHLRTFAKRHDITVRFEHEGVSTRLGANVEIAGYRTVQEALTNVARHANATKCTVTVRHWPTTLSIVVQDDGCGFEPTRVSATGTAAGLGLLGIRERIAQLGGALTVQSAPGSGTTLSVDIPLPPHAADETSVSGQSHKLAAGNGQLEAGGG